MDGRSPPPYLKKKVPERAGGAEVAARSGVSFTRKTYKRTAIPLRASADRLRVRAYGAPRTA